MRNNVLDIISDINKIDYKKEYNKLYDLFITFPTYKKNNQDISIMTLFNEKIEKWKYRGTCTSYHDVFEKLNIKSNPRSDSLIDSLLNLIELLLNIELFVKNDILYNSRRDYLYGTHYYLKSNIVYDNCLKILHSLNYKEKILGDKVSIIPNDVDLLITIEESKDKNLIKSIVDYSDYRNKNNIALKKEKLNNIADYLEPIRKKIPNSDLENTIFNLFNNINIRHNNKSGKKKNEFATNLTDNEQLEWYDKTFNLCLIAIRLIEFKSDKMLAIFKKINND